MEELSMRVSIFRKFYNSIKDKHESFYESSFLSRQRILQFGIEFIINIVIPGSRATSIFRFGFISLDLISIVLQDSGEYLCRVVSSTGVAESRATLSVTRKSKRISFKEFYNCPSEGVNVCPYSILTRFFRTMEHRALLRYVEHRTKRTNIRDIQRKLYRT